MDNGRYGIRLTVSKAVQTDIQAAVPKKATVIRAIESRKIVDRNPDISFRSSAGARSGAVSEVFIVASRSSSTNPPSGDTGSFGGFSELSVPYEL